MKMAPDGVYVHKRGFVGVRSVREQDEDPLLDRVDPKAGPRKPEVAKTLGRQVLAGSRSGRGRKLKRQGSMFVLTRGKVRRKESTALRL